MKKVISKITSFALSISLCSTTLSLKNFQSFETKAFRYDSEFNYSSLLDSNNITVYHNLASFVDPKMESVFISLPEEIRVNIGVRQDHYAPLNEEEDKMVSDAVWSNVMPGCYYFLMDYPDAFWQESENISFAYHTNNQNNIYDENTHETFIVIKDVEVNFPIDPTLNNDISLARKYKDNLSKEIYSFEVSGNTRFEKVKSIHDNLALRVVYTYDTTLSHSAGGSLVEGKSVCEGYAKAFKLICDRENIPCILVLNKNHMWNEVRMEDGNWYIVDVTGDDYNGKIQKIEVDYNCFLKGKSFYEEHPRIYEYYGIPYEYPEVPDEDYFLDEPLKPILSTDIQKTETTITTASNTSTTETTTTTSSTASSNITESSTTTTAFVPEEHADLNGDGSINVTDAIICHIAILYDVNVDCDINNDGRTNSFDLIIIKKIIKKNK